MNIAITGASGFIGMEMSYLLFKRNHRLKLFVQRSIDKEKKRFLEQYGELYFISERTPFDFRGIEIVFHLAGKKNGSSQDLYQSNILLSNKVIDEVIKRKCSKLVFASSYYVYAKSKEKIDENSPVSPGNLYAATKIVTEMEIKERLIQNSYIIARLSHIFGVNKAGYFNDDVLTKMMMFLISRKDINFSANPILDFLDVQNVVRYLIAIALSKGFYGCINIGSGYAIDLVQLYNVVKETIKYKNYNFRKMTDKNIKSKKNYMLALDIKRLKELLHEKGEYNLKRELRRTYKLLKEHYNEG